MLQCFFIIMGIFFAGIKCCSGIFCNTKYTKVLCFCIKLAYYGRMMSIHPYTKLFFIFLNHTNCLNL